jgi:hypothetical protein
MQRWALIRQLQHLLRGRALEGATTDIKAGETCCLFEDLDGHIGAWWAVLRIGLANAGINLDNWLF